MSALKRVATAAQDSTGSHYQPKLHHPSMLSARNKSGGTHVGSMPIATWRWNRSYWGGKFNYLGVRSTTYGGLVMRLASSGALKVDHDGHGNFLHTCTVGSQSDPSTSAIISHSPSLWSRLIYQTSILLATVLLITTFISELHNVSGRSPPENFANYSGFLYGMQQLVCFHRAPLLWCRDPVPSPPLPLYLRDQPE